MSYASDHPFKLLVPIERSSLKLSNVWSVIRVMRMRGVALADAIVVSAETRRLVEGYFELRGLGLTELKGIAEPIEMFEVVAAGPLTNK